MADKRTAELGTMDVSVAYVDGLIVVDSLTLQSVDGEQQKVLISTLLEYFRNQGEDFYIGALNLSRITTTNNSTTDVMLLDGSGNVRIRNIGDLIQGTELIETDFIKVSNEISESPVQSAATQATINEQINSVLTSLQDQIDNVTNLGATATIEVDPVPFSVTTTEAIITFNTVFESTNTNIFDTNDDDNEVNVYAIGTYQIAVFLDVSNADTSATHTLTLRIRDVDTDEIYSEAEIFVYKDGYSGTWLNRFSLTNAPINVYFTAESTDASDLAIEASQMNIISLSSGVADLVNPYMLNVFGQDDDSVDSTNLQDAISSLTENQQLNLFGTFYLTSQIDFELLTNNLINCSAAFLKFYRTDTDPICFNIKDSKNLTFLNISGSFEHASTSTNAYIFATEYNTVIPENIIIENLKVPLIGGTVTDYVLFYSPADSDTIHINNVICDYGQIYVYQNSIVENVYLSDSGSYIGADLACKILKCYVNTITVTDDNNNIVSNNFATTYYGDTGTNRFSNNIGLTGGGGSLDPADDVEITGNWYFSQNVGFGGISSPSEAVEIGGNLLLNTAAPYIDLYNSSGATDLKYWRIINNSSKLIFRNLDDTQVTDQNVLTLNASNGYVGILNSSPAYPLDIDGSMYVSEDLIISSNVGIGDDTPVYKLSILENNNTYAAAYVRQNGTAGGMIVYCPYSTGTIFRAYKSATAQLILLSSGAVGINKNSPIYSLDVDGDISATGRIIAGEQDEESLIGLRRQNDGTMIATFQVIESNEVRSTHGGGGGFFTWYTNYSSATVERMRLSNAGNFGIGTTSPSYKLHVEGNSYFNGDVNIADNLQVDQDADFYSNVNIYGTFNLAGGITIANNPDKVLYIAVNSGGTIARQNGNLVCTSVNNYSTGNYDVYFASTAGYNVYCQVVSISEDDDYNAAIGNIDDTYIHVQCYNSSGTFVNSAFHLYVACYVII